MVKRLLPVYAFILLGAGQYSLAREGVVVTLEAPLFRLPQTDSPIIQRLHKNQVISLHQQDPDDDEEDEQETFYQTTDRNGRTAFVLSKHIKLITADENEDERPMTSFDLDQTDYRMREPLPKNYPFQRPKQYRMLMAFGQALGKGQTYQYGQNPRMLDSSLNTQLWLRFTREIITKKAEEPRLYFGGLFRLSFGQSSAQFVEEEAALESYLTLTLGPTLSYDLFRNERGDRVAISGGIGIDLIDSHRVQIAEESHLFQGLGLGLFFSFQYRRKHIMKHWDLVLAPYSYLNLPRELKSNSSKQENLLWKSQGTMQQSASIELGGLIGLQYEYY